MPTTYGTNTAFELMRSTFITNLDALAANMVTNNIVPRFDAVYDTHWENPAIDFYAISLGVPEIIGTSPSPSVGAGRYEFLYQIELRIMMGEYNQAHSEVTFMQLANSVVNWFLSHISFGNNFAIKTDSSGRDIFRVEFPVVFEDTRTIGGRVWFFVYGIEAFTQL